MNVTFTDPHTGKAYTRAKFEEARLEVVAHDFGVVDAKGRKVGAKLYTFRRTITPDASSSSLYRGTDLPEGGKVQFGYRIQSTRDGQAFGACTLTNWFDTVEQAQGKAEKALASSRKRQAKQHAAQ